MPEYRLPVDPAQMFFEISPDQSRRYRFQIVDQFAQLNRRVCLNQQVNMIGLAIKFNQFTSPFLERLPKDHPQPFEHLFRDRPAAIFRH
jgi:hypothetical protein